MRTHLEFVSAAFDPDPGEDEATNPGLFGRRLAELLAAAFGQQGQRPGPTIAEDWGWMVPLRNEGFPVWPGCASHDAPPNWMVFTEPSQPTIRKLFRRIDTTVQVEAVAMQLETILVDRGNATQLRWWNDSDSGRN